MTKPKNDQPPLVRYEFVKIRVSPIDAMNAALLEQVRKYEPCRVIDVTALRADEVLVLIEKLPL